jgi:hypothetical protein
MTNDAIKYPVFLRDLDRWMYLIRDEKEVYSELELIDVEGGEYSGWDSDGKPIEIGLKDGERGWIRLISTECDPGAVRDEILHFASMLNSVRPFSPSRDDLSLLELFEEVERFRYNRGLLWKLVGFFHRKLYE